jgi:hypothetical protein
MARSNFIREIRPVTDLSQTPKQFFSWFGKEFENGCVLVQEEIKKELLAWDLRIPKE